MLSVKQLLLIIHQNSLGTVASLRGLVGSIAGIATPRLCVPLLYVGITGNIQGITGLLAGATGALQGLTSQHYPAYSTKAGLHGSLPSLACTNLYQHGYLFANPAGYSSVPIHHCCIP